MRAAASLGPFLALCVTVSSLSVGMATAPDVFAPELKALAARAEEVAPSATVAGRLSLAGRALPYTRVDLHGGERVHLAYTRADGSFRLEGVAPGEYEVSIHPPLCLPPDDPALAGPQGPPSVDVPARYRQATTSGLRLHLPPGASRRTIDLRR
jgi:hypothetical protein